MELRQAIVYMNDKQGNNVTIHLPNDFSFSVVIPCYVDVINSLNAQYFLSNYRRPRSNRK